MYYKLTEHICSLTPRNSPAILRLGFNKKKIKAVTDTVTIKSNVVNNAQKRDLGDHDILVEEMKKN